MGGGRRIVLPVIVGLVLTLAILMIGGVPEAGTEAFWKKLCDAFTVPGILLTGTGLLSLVSDQGAFDGIAFPVRKVLGLFFSEEKRAAMPKTYFDYVAARQKRGAKKPRGTLFTGLAFLAAAGITLVIYLTRYPL